MKRNTNYMPAQKADLLSKVIMIENKLDPAMDLLLNSDYYATLPAKSAEALLLFIYNNKMDATLPEYEVAEFERKFRHLARWTANIKNFEERLAKL